MKRRPNRWDSQGGQITSAIVVHPRQRRLCLRRLLAITEFVDVGDAVGRGPEGFRFVGQAVALGVATWILPAPYASTG